MQRFTRKSSTQLGASCVTSYVRWCASRNGATLDPQLYFAKARSLTAPSETFPATAGIISGPTDPKIFWREHWDNVGKKPYYENVSTYEVSFTIPEGFPTRFGSYYVGKGINVIDDIVQPKGFAGSTGTSQAARTQVRQFSMSRRLNGIKAAPEGTDPSKMTMKQRIAVYGTAGLVLYLIIHNTLLFCIFVTLYVFEYDLVSVARSYGYELKFLPGGSKKTTTKKGEDGADEITEEILNDPSLLATFITAVALCKLVVPFQLTLTLALAPTVAPRLNVLLQRIKARRGYGAPPSVTPPV